MTCNRDWISHRGLVILACVATLLCVAGAANAAPLPTATGDFFANLAKALDPLFDGAIDFEKRLTPVGYAFLGIALVLQVFGIFVKFLAKGGASDLVSEIFRVLIVLSIPLAMLKTWPVLPNYVFKEFTEHVGGLITGTSQDATSQISTVITQLFGGLGDHLLRPPPASTGGGISAAITASIIDAVLSIVLFIPFVLFAVATLFALFGPLLMLYVGVIMGPILVPWIVWKPLESLALRWLNYMITMGAAFVIGLLMAELVIHSVGVFGDAIANANDGSGMGSMVASFGAIAGLLPNVIVMLFGAYMMLKCEHIAASLVGGSAVGGGMGLFFAGSAALRNGGKGKGDKPKPEGKPEPGASDAAPAGGQGAPAPATGADLSRGAGNASAPSGGSGGSGGGGSSSSGGGGGESAPKMTDGGATFGNVGEAAGGAAANDDSAAPGGAPAAANEDSYGHPSGGAEPAAGQADGATGGDASAARGQAASSTGGGSVVAAGGGSPANSGGQTGGAGKKAPFRERFANRVGSMSGPAKAAAFSAAAVAGIAAGPVGAAAAVGAGVYALSPKARAGVNKAIHGGEMLAGKASKFVSHKPKDDSGASDKS